MINHETILRRISEAIMQSGLSQTQIAKEIGVCQQAVSSYVKCQKLPALDTFANLCKTVDGDPSYILGLSD